MEIRLPTWSLRNERCPCCGGQGELCFSACPECVRLVLVCAEAGTVFADVRAASRRPYGSLDDKACVCPGCRRVSISLFRDASDQEIQAAGFTPADYV